MKQLRHPSRNYAVTNDELREIATRIRRATGNVDVVALCDAVLAMRPVKAPQKNPPAVSNDGCPACAERRAVKAASQRRFRVARKRG